MGMWPQLRSRALVCTVSRSCPVMPFNSVKRKEHEPGEQEAPASLPVPHSL